MQFLVRVIVDDSSDSGNDGAVRSAVGSAGVVDELSEGPHESGCFLRTPWGASAIGYEVGIFFCGYGCVCVCSCVGYDDGDVFADGFLDLVLDNLLDEFVELLEGFSVFDWTDADSVAFVHWHVGFSHVNS